MSFAYKCSDGTVVDFCNGAYFADPDTFRSYAFAYTCSNGRVVAFSTDEVEITLPITVMADDADEANELADSLIELFERDVASGKSGEISVDGYTSKVFVVSASLDTQATTGEEDLELSATFLFECPKWVAEKTMSFFPRNSEGNGYLDYPHGYPYNYAPNDSAQFFENPYGKPCNIRLTIYGPAVNPYIYINGNRYEVLVSVPAGGHLVIDARDRSAINMFDSIGNATNVFANRTRGTKGSGAYIYEMVNPGYNSVSWDNTFGFDVAIYDERRWIPCSTSP